MSFMTTRNSPSNSTKYLKQCYKYAVNHTIAVFLLPIAISIIIQALRLGPEELLKLWRSLHFDPAHVLSISFLVILVANIYYMSRPRKVYLIDYACYLPPACYRTPYSTTLEHAKLVLKNEKVIDFQMRILERSGLGEETCLPPAVHYIPPNPTLDDGYAEAQTTIFATMDSLLKKTGLRPKDIDILVVNCSIFCPTPSLSAMIVNKYKLRSNIKSFNLGGMGCSASLISIDLARDLLQANPNSNAVVVSLEVITPNLYMGNERSMLVPNCLFRMGGAAILLSNRSQERKRAKYSLLHVVRTHKGADDRAFNCVRQVQDPEGIVGVSLSKDLMAVAGDALKTNITTIGPLVLPPSEQLLFALSFIGRKFINPKWKAYVPDFKEAFEHFCIHAGGRAVIDEMQKSLNLTAEQVEASRMTLHRFGNTSSSCLWYELSYIESKGRMKEGDRVWQIGVGSGFKCNSAVWKCMKTIKTPIDDAWATCIHRYPVHIPDVLNL
ncbi:hypothetical protein Nepgr_029349 [Nepenthes gracilis]|uniref:3-ketoacyl-CoA synthase n=1 Tax=Nepenthes gracilis TaxID=150966 RepID=A0AAD3TE04_NEPGR|nr:hypothetical protein Nepgr_029349 [Nepenthes gracilis]